jgi:exosortase
MKAFLWIFLPLLVAYSTALQWCIDRWNAPTQYFEHCWLVPWIAAAAIWARRRSWSVQVANPDGRAWWMLGAALLLHLYGAALMIDSASAASMILAVPGAAWLAFGKARLRGLWPMLWLVLFAVPTPIYVEGRLAFVLKEFAVHAGAILANWLGADVVRAGSHLQVQGTGQALFVADACGGLRSLLAMVTLGYCLAFLVGIPRLSRRVPLLLATVPIAISANVVRIAVLCLQSRWFGVPFAESTGHTVANIAEWIADLGVLLMMDALLTRRIERAQPTTVPAQVAPQVLSTGRPRSLARQGVLLWALALPLLLLSLYRPHGGDRQRAQHLPEEFAGWTRIERTEREQAEFQKALPRWIELLGTPDFTWQRYRDAQGFRIHLVALFHDTNWKSVHAPRICIEGSNMDIELDDLVPAPELGTGVTVSRIVARSREDGWRYLTLSVFGTRDWASGSYAEFSWHHMPLALLRRNESGFLLRTETPMPKGEAVEVAQRRCVEFLSALLPKARELLR